MTRRMKEYNYETGRTRWLPQSSCLLLFYLYPTDQSLWPAALVASLLNLNLLTALSHLPQPHHFSLHSGLYTRITHFLQMHEPSSHNLTIPSICHLRGHTKTGPPRDTRFLWEALKKKKYIKWTKNERATVIS